MLRVSFSPIFPTAVRERCGAEASISTFAPGQSVGAGMRV